MRNSNIEYKEIAQFITLFGQFPRNTKTYKELLDQFGQMNDAKLNAVLQEMVDQNLLRSE